MTELITISTDTIDGEPIQTVNARDLYEFLDVRRDFTTWAKDQIKRARLLEGRDYLLTQKGEQHPSGTKYVSDYHLTIDAAKHISMMSGCDKGFEVRDYFIECEKRAKGADPITLLNDPAVMRGLLLTYSEKVLQLEAVNAEMRPKADFFDAVTGSTTAVDMAVVAKTLNMGIGRNQLFEFLREKSVLDRKNTPYQSFVDRGYFRIVESSYSKPDGSTHVNFKTVVFQKGMDYIRKLLLER